MRKTGNPERRRLLYTKVTTKSCGILDLKAKHGYYGVWRHTRYIYEKWKSESQKC